MKNTQCVGRGRIELPLSSWIAPQPNIQIIEDIKNTAPPTTLIQPPASSSFLDSFPLPVSSINTDIPNSMVPTTIRLSPYRGVSTLR